MKHIVDELKKIIPFKDTTTIGDIVLIVAKEPKMLLYAHIDDIQRDSARKDDEWWHLTLTMLAIPLQKMTWTLRTQQMEGRELFTMGGEERFFKAVDFGGVAVPEISPEDVKKIARKGLKRVK